MIQRRVAAHGLCTALDAWLQHQLAVGFSCCVSPLHGARPHVSLAAWLCAEEHCPLCATPAQGLSPLWALSHFSVLLLCALVALAGMIVSLVRFGNTVTGLVMSTHQVLGLLSVGESAAVSLHACCMVRCLFAAHGQQRLCSTQLAVACSLA